MRKIDKYWLISTILGITWILLLIFQIKQPSILRGVLMWIPLILSGIFYWFYKIKNNVKSELYDQNRKKHIRNHIIYIGAIISTIFIIGLVYLQF